MPYEKIKIGKMPRAMTKTKNIGTGILIKPSFDIWLYKSIHPNVQQRSCKLSVGILTFKAFGHFRQFDR